MALSSLDAVKGRIRHQTIKALEAEQTNHVALPAKCREKPNKLYDIEIVAEDDEQEQVKVHYIGYSSSYDEWKPSSEVVICPPSTTTQSDYSSPFDVLACMIKKQLVPSKTDPAVRLQLPFNLDSWQLLQQASIYDHGGYKIEQYSELDQFLGSGWHYRVCNTRGDFSYAMVRTIRFHLFHPKPILEYSVSIQSDDKMKYTPEYTVQCPQLVFSFVRHDGNHKKLREFLSNVQQ
jgi:hypothetical protein